MRADDIFVLVLLTMFFGFIVTLAVRSRRQSRAGAGPQPGNVARRESADDDTQSAASAGPAS